MKPELSRVDLIAMAKEFATQQHIYPKLYGATDCKAVGTFIESAFQEVLDARYQIDLGNAALGLDLPSLETAKLDAFSAIFQRWVSSPLTTSRMTSSDWSV